MGIRFSRRSMMRGAGGVALAQSFGTAGAAAAPRKWPIEEGPDTPKLCLAPGDGGGPLPSNAQPAVPAATGRGGRGQSFGGFLAPQTEASPAVPANYQRIRQLGVCRR